MTIKSFTDHAANERTFLAWVRTGIAVMAFGFLVERFDIFLKIAASTLRQPRSSVFNQAFGNIAGLGLILAGAMMIFLSALRFRNNAKAIDSPDARPSARERLDFALTAMLTLLGVALAIYLLHALS